MISYKNFSWVYKAKYWEVSGGKFHWHNPQTNRVEEFHPGQAGPGPHEAVAAPERTPVATELRGEWWLDDSGQATFADGDVSDANHAMVAMEAALGISFEDLPDDAPEMFPHEKLSPKAVAWLKEQGVNDEAIEHFRRGRDPRDYAMNKMGWVRVKNNMFQAASFNDNALKNIQNFIFENIDNPEEAEGEVMVEEMSTNSVYELPIKYLVMEQATAAGLKSFADRRKGVPA